MTGMTADNAMVEELIAKVTCGEMTRTEALRECRDREDCSGLTWFVLATRLPHEQVAARIAAMAQEEQG